MESIKEALIKVIEELYGVSYEPTISYAPSEFGDFSTNIAFQVAAHLKSSPDRVASELAKRLKSQDLEIEAVKGYLNIKLPTDYWLEALTQALDKGDDFGLNEPNSKGRVIIDYGQPNTHKLPHIGHLYCYIAGESVANLLEAEGYEVRRVNYQGDVGPHVAKAVYAWVNIKNRYVPESLTDKIALLQECYQEGSRLYEESDQAKQSVQLINKQIYEQDPNVIRDWETTRKWSLDYYQELEARLGVSQDAHYLESGVWKNGLDIVKASVGKVFEVDAGAVIYRGESRGLHNRVFITREGTPTYEAKEIGLTKAKFTDWPADLSVVMTAREQAEYFKVVFSAIEDITPNLKSKLQHISFGMVNLKNGKMSSRKGNILSATDLIEEVIIRTQQAGYDKSPADTETVAMSALKYGFLKTGLGSDIVFDIDKAISLHGDSGPYLQYVSSRLASLLTKASMEPKVNKALKNTKLSSVERSLLIQILRYPSVVATAAESRSPHIVANYLFELAQLFNKFYEENQIIGSQQETLRLDMVRLLKNVINSGLRLLGITPINRI